MRKIKAVAQAASDWMDESLDNRCCAVLAAMALGFWISIARMNWLGAVPVF